MATRKKRRASPLARALRERDEALAFQAATAEILASISRSSSDPRPVFESIVKAVLQLFGTRYAAVFLVKGDELHLAASRGDSSFEKKHTAAFKQFRASFPQRIDWNGFTGKALRAGKAAQIAPIIGNPAATPQAVALAKSFAYDAMLLAPLMHEGKAIGAIGTTRPEAEPFDARQLALFDSFAAQAVIAIENARLFNETKDALEQQTATSEILKAISSSQTDLQPVFETIIRNAVRVGGADLGTLIKVEDDKLHVAAHSNLSSDSEKLFRSGFPQPLSRDSAYGRAIMDLQVAAVVDFEAAPPSAAALERARAIGIRSALAVPLVRGGVALGAIAIGRRHPGGFEPAYVSLVKTFADQAVIAIENVRLFNETKEALEQQTATADILKVISGSPTDVQPVFEAIVRSAVSLCKGFFANAFRYDGERLHLLATSIDDPEARKFLESQYPRVPDKRQMSGRAILAKAVVRMQDALADPEYDRRHADVAAWRRMLGVPMLQEGRPIGAIVVAWAEPGPIPEAQEKLLKTFADQAAIAIENVRLFNETKAALERQIATAEILRVIAASPSDVQPVFETIIHSASKLSRGCSVNVSRLIGDQLHLAAYTPVSPEADDTLKRMYPIPATEARPLAEAVRRKAAFFVSDFETDPGVSRKAREVMRARGFRSTLYVPMVRGDVVHGVMHVSKVEPGPFPQEWIDLLKTFADQAVIAIENVRLFNETKEALERQTATAEVLRVISTTPADPHPVFQAIAESALRVFAAFHTGVGLIEGNEFAFKASAGPPDPRGNFRIPLDRSSTAGCAILDRKPFVVPDSEAPDAVPFARESGRAVGFRALVSAPMLRDGAAVGVVTVMRKEPGPFSDQEIELLQTFAQQAVIAIENARLFRELQERNRALSEALEQQTATGEILKVISSTQTDVQPVFDTIIGNAVRLGSAKFGLLLQFDGRLVSIGAHHNFAPDAASLFHRAYPQPPSADNPVLHAVLDGEVKNVPDVLDSIYSEAAKARARATGYRSLLAVPMLRNGVPVGAIGVARAAPGPFAEGYVALLRTFAAQAVIAIDNVRLFNETKEALEQQTAISDILRAISSSPSDLQPVFDTILSHSVSLCEGSRAVLWQLDGRHLRVAAHKNGNAEGISYLKNHPLELGGYNATPQAALERRTVHVVDAFAQPNYRPLIPTGAVPNSAPTPTVLAVPLLRDEEVLGVITIWRHERRPFTEKQIAMVNTFASQAVIAIENVRLFNETKEALEQQTASADVLGAISSSIADTQPVFDKILESCRRLFGGHDTGIGLVGEDGLVHLAAHRGPNVEELREVFPVPLSVESGTGSAILGRAVMHYPDVFGGPDVPDYVRRSSRKVDFKSVVFAPMFWEGRGIGAIWVGREFVGAFTEKQIALLKTFADQAVIAIQNARLVNEIKEALDQQKASAEVLQVISSSIADTRPVFDKILVSCERLFEGHIVGINLVGEDGLAHLTAYHGPNRDEVEKVYPLPLNNESATGAVILARKVLQYPDVFGRADVPDYLRRSAEKIEVKSVIFAPMLWEERAIGVIFVARQFAGEFSEKAVRQLKTFTDQAVIAIQNARLFREIQEKSAQLEIANKHKSDFLANMSHELRTPLNAIIGFSEVLSERMFGEVNDKQAEYLKDIHESGRHLLSLINDILDLSKIEAGRMELELSSFHLPSAVSNAMTLVRERAQRHGIALASELDPAVGEFEGDERKVKQILLNLLSNAVKFTPDGGRVDVAARKVDGRIEIAVHDTGIGIAPEDHAAVFEEFKQVGRDYTRKAEGTGLGLALTKRLVELHGGEIALESAPGKGSTFTVRLPLR